MRRLFLTLGVLVAICIILISFSNTSLHVRNTITGMDSIPFKIPSHKNNINTSLIMPASVQRTFEASGFQVKSIIDAKEVNSTQGKVYEFILYEDDSKWLLKYNENGKLLDSNKLSEANNLDQLLP